MEYNRGELKRSVKSIMRQTKPSPLLVTLVFLLVASLVPMIIEWFTSQSASLLAYMTNMTQIIETGDEDLIMAYLTNMPGQNIGVGMLISIFLSLFSMVMGMGYYWYCLKMVRGEETSYGDIFSGFAQAGWIVLMYILMGIFIFLWSMLIIFVAVILIFFTALAAAGISNVVVAVVAVVIYIAAIVLIVIVAMRYAMAPFIFLDNPGIGALEPIRRSKMMMKGQIGRLFVLGLSFIGWYLLVVLIYGVVMGIGMAIAGVASMSLFTANSTGAMATVVASIGVSSIVGYLITIPLMLWLQPYVTGAMAQFYQWLSNSGMREMPPLNRNFNGQPPYDGNQRRPLSDYEPKPQAPSTPGYDPEKNAPVENSQPVGEPKPEDKPNDQLPN